MVTRRASLRRVPPSLPRFPLLLSCCAYRLVFRHLVVPISLSVCLSCLAIASAPLTHTHMHTPATAHARPTRIHAYAAPPSSSLHLPESCRLVHAKVTSTQFSRYGIASPGVTRLAPVTVITPTPITPTPIGDRLSASFDNSAKTLPTKSVKL